MDLLDRLLPACLYSAAQRNLDKSARVKTFSLRVGRPGSRGLTACPSRRCVLRVLGVDRRTSSNWQSEQLVPGFSGGSRRSFFDARSLNLVRNEYQMLERLREAERGAACLCQLSSADHRGPWRSTPTYPTCCAGSTTAGLAVSAARRLKATKVHFQSPAAVHFRTRRRTKQSTPHSSELSRSSF